MTSDYRVVVEFEDVKAEGMIKKEVAINPELKKKIWKEREAMNLSWSRQLQKRRTKNI